MMQSVLGRVFPQKGVLLKALVEGVGVQAFFDASDSGNPGSFNGIRSELSGSRLNGQFSQVTNTPSPVSASNLLFVRETVVGAALGITAISICGLWV
jgi:hypothetical protein